MEACVLRMPGRPHDAPRSAADPPAAIMLPGLDMPPAGPGPDPGDDCSRRAISSSMASSASCIIHQHGHRSHNHMHHYITIATH